ncbi:MAG: putative glycosyltransferase [Actinomycetia bacterium]|nr:putative glycosyltransferase [Actinomycetes bacterium]
MRILLVNDLAPGPDSDVEVHVARLADGLRAAGDDVELFAGEVVHRGPSRVLDVWNPSARRKLATRAAAFRPDIVHHHVVRELSASVLGIPPGVPQVLTVHDFHRLGDAGAAAAASPVATRVKAGLDRSVARRRVDLAIAMSEPLGDALRQAGFTRVVHVSPFADRPTETPPPPSACLNVAFAGPLAADKGLSVLADAWPTVLHAHPWARLCVAGAGPLALRLAALDRVDQLGSTSTEQVRDMLLGARVVVVPSMPGSRGQSLPTVAIEAAMFGRPLVVSDHPGLAAFATASGGALVTRGGDADALAKAITRLLEDDVLADELGAAGAAHAGSHHTTEAGVATLRALYAELGR